MEKLSPYKQALALAVMNRAMTRKVTMGHFAHTVALKYANDPERVKRNRSLARPVKDIFLDLLPEYNNAVFDNYQSNKSFNEDAIELLPNISISIDLLYLDRRIAQVILTIKHFIICLRHSLCIGKIKNL